MQIMTICGRVGRDAELRSVGNDQVCGFSVAVDQRNGRDDKTTNWFRVSLWGKRGESLSRYLLKGASVTVSGEFSLTEYEGKPQLNIRANDIALQGGVNDRAQSAGNDRQQAQQRGGQAGGWTGGAADDESDIPFATSNSVF